MTPYRDSGGDADMYYRRLKVTPSASRDEIVSAYRRLALGAHPDAHPEDPEASERFREISEAYEVLGDPVRREAYDANTPIRRSVPVRRRASAGGTMGRAMTVETQAIPPITFLGDLSNRPMSDVPLRVGPVHIGPSPAQGEISDFGTALFDLLDSWWRR